MNILPCVACFNLELKLILGVWSKWANDYHHNNMFGFPAFMECYKKGSQNTCAAYKAVKK